MHVQKNQSCRSYQEVRDRLLGHFNLYQLIDIET